MSDVASILARFEEPTALLAPVVITGKAADNQDYDRSLFQIVGLPSFGLTESGYIPFTRVIPTINIGSALGIDDWATRLAVDALADPLNYITTGYTAAARTALATKYVSSSRKLSQLTKIHSLAELARTDASTFNRIQELARLGDVRGLSKYRKYLEDGSAGAKKFFGGSQGRAIKRALELGEDRVQLLEGAASQAAAGQRRLLGARLPFTDKEITLVKGDKLFQFAEDTLGIKWLKKVGKGHLDDMARTLTKSAHAEAAADRLEELALSMERASAGDPKNRALSEAAANLRKSANLDELRANYKVAETRLNDVENAFSAEARLRAEGNSIVKRFAQARGDIKKLKEFLPESRAFEASEAKIAASLEPTHELRLASLSEAERAALKAGKKVAPTLQNLSGFGRRLGMWLDRASTLGSRKEVVEATTAQLDSILESFPAPTLTAAEQAAGIPDPKGIRSFLKEYRAAATQTLPDAATARSLAAKHNVEWLFADKVNATGVGLSDVTEWDRASKALVRGITAAIPSINSALDAAKTLRGKKAAKLAKEAENAVNQLRGLVGNLMAVDPDAGLAMEAALLRSFPTLAGQGIAPIAVPSNLADLSNDVIAGLNDAASTEFGGKGRGIYGKWGLEFNAETIADNYHGYMRQELIRVQAFFDRSHSAWASLMEGVKDLVLPRGYTDDASKLDPRLAGHSDMYVVSDDIGRTSIEGVLPDASADRLPPSAPSVSQRALQFSEIEARTLGSKFTVFQDFSRQVNERLGLDVSQFDIAPNALIEPTKTPDIGTLHRAAAAKALKSGKPVISFMEEAGGTDKLVVLSHSSDPAVLRQFIGEGAAFVTQDRVYLTNPDPSVVSDVIRKFTPSNVEEFNGQLTRVEPGTASKGLAVHPGRLPTADAIRAHYDRLPAPRAAVPSGYHADYASFGDVVYAPIEPGADRAAVPSRVYADAATAPTGSAKIRLTQHDILASKSGDLRLITGRTEFHRGLDFVHAEPWLEDSGQLSPVELPDPARSPRSTVYFTKHRAEQVLSLHRVYRDISRSKQGAADLLDRLAEAHHLAPGDPTLATLAREVNPNFGKLKGKQLFSFLDKLETRIGRESGLVDEVVRAPADFDTLAKSKGRAGLVRVAMRGDGPVKLNMGKNTISTATGDIFVAERPRQVGKDGRNLLFIRAINDPSLRGKLTYTERALLDVTTAMLEQASRIGHGVWFEEHLKNYFPRIVHGAKGVSQTQLNARLSEVVGRMARGRSSSRFFKQRLVDSFDELLKLEAEGVLEVEKNPQKILKTYFDQLAQVSANQRLMDTLMRNRTLDGSPILVLKTQSQRILKSAMPGVKDAIKQYLSFPSEKFPILSRYMVHRDFNFLAKAFGPQTVSQAIRESSNGFFRTLQEFNLKAKGFILSMSFFHYVALHQSLVGAVGPKLTAQFFESQFRSNRLFRKVVGGAQDLGSAVRANTFTQLWGEAGGLIEYGLGKGLVLDTFEKLAGEEFQSFFGKIAKAAQEGKLAGGKLVRSPITGLYHYNEFVNRATWEITHNSGKTLVFQQYLLKLMKDFPDVPMDTLARQAAQSANSAMGGLNWSKIFGDSKARQILQLAFLAPDWTLSNLINARDLFVGLAGNNLTRNAAGKFSLPLRDLVMPTAAANLARKFWANTFIYIFLTKQLMNLAFTGQSTFQNPGDVEDKLEVWTGRRDPTNGRPIMLYTGKQFSEPVQLLFEPMRFVTRKVSVLGADVGSIFLQRDQFGSPITLPDDSLAVGVLKNFGYLGKRSLPIPGANLLQAARRFNKGEGDIIDLLNPFTSSFDLAFRRARTQKGVSFAVAEKDAVPSTINLDLLGPSEVSVVK